MRNDGNLEYPTVDEESSNGSRSLPAKIGRLNITVQTHITLLCSNQTNLSEVMKVLDQIVKLYGLDNQGSTILILTPYEVNEIENDTMWSGRNWWFNKTHRLWDSENGESIAYMMFLDSTNYYT